MIYDDYTLNQKIYPSKKKNWEVGSINRQAADKSFYLKGYHPSEKMYFIKIQLTHSKKKILGSIRIKMHTSVLVSYKFDIRDISFRIYLYMSEDKTHNIYGHRYRGGYIQRWIVLQLSKWYVQTRVPPMRRFTHATCFT